MDNLPFGNEGFDLIWSEGAIYNIGFERGLNEWRKFLKPGGYIAVTEVSWLIDKRPAEIENFWNENYPEIDTIPNKVVQMQKAGYIPVAIFVLPEKCWTDNYYIPRQAASKVLLDKYTGNKTVEAFVESNRYEVDLYSKYRQYYGYVFYIGKKVSIYKKERN
jgi:SAM-dependent methyltransferase